MSTVTEQELIASATAPRISLEGLEANIAQEYYINAKEAIEANGYGGVPSDVGLLTICILVLTNGFTVMGQSACADPKNYNPLIGQKLALTDAKNKIWALMGYELKTELMKAGGTHTGRLAVELGEVKARYIKLEAFIGTATYLSLSEHERTRLDHQAEVMEEYIAVLEARINDI